MTDAVTGTGFNTGRAFQYATTILKRDLARLALFSVLFVGLPDAAVTFLTPLFADTAAGYRDPAVWVMLLLGMLVILLGGMLLQAIAARGLAKDLGDRRAGEVAFGQPRDWLALVALATVTGLGILCGFMLLVIPGVVLSLAWLVVVPAMVTERLGVMEAIRRSNRLTGGARGTIFGLTIAVGLVGFIPAWLLQLLADAIANPVVSAIVDPTMQSVSGLVNAIFAVAIYHELRWSKEGAPTDRLVEVFA